MVKKVNAIQTNDTSDWVKKTDYDLEIKDSDIMKIYHDQYFTTNNFIKFSREIFDERFKHLRFKHFKYLTKLATNIDLSTVEQRSTKNERKR